MPHIELHNCRCGRCYTVVTDEHTNPNGTLSSSGELFLNPDCLDDNPDRVAAAAARRYSSKGGGVTC